MKRLILIVILSFVGHSITFAQGMPTPPPKTTKARPAVETRTPDSYKRRQALFHGIMEKEATREKKVAKAIDLAQNPRSGYRIDAINFLADTRSKDAVPALQGLASDTNVREFVLYALGEIPNERSVPMLITALSDNDENVRGNAERAFRKIVHTNFVFKYSDPSAQRKKNIETIKEWWAANNTTFKVREESPEDKKAAEEAWEKFGKPYVYDLNR